MSYFIFFFAFYSEWSRWQWFLPIYVVSFLRRETIDVEDIMQFKSRWKLQVIVQVQQNFYHSKRAKLFRA
jgi:hypothetical protein